MYYTLTYPHLHNGLHLWGATYQTYLNSLSTLQKMALCITLNVPRLQHTMPIFQKLSYCHYASCMTIVFANICTGFIFK